MGYVQPSEEILGLEGTLRGSREHLLGVASRTLAAQVEDVDKHALQDTREALVFGCWRHEHPWHSTTVTAAGPGRSNSSAAAAAAAAAAQPRVQAQGLVPVVPDPQLRSSGPGAGHYDLRQHGVDARPSIRR